MVLKLNKHTICIHKKDILVLTLSNCLCFCLFVCLFVCFFFRLFRKINLFCTRQLEPGLQWAGRRIEMVIFICRSIASTQAYYKHVWGGGADAKRGSLKNVDPCNGGPEKNYTNFQGKLSLNAFSTGLTRNFHVKNGAHIFYSVVQLLWKRIYIWLDFGGFCSQSFTYCIALVGGSDQYGIFHSFGLAWFFTFNIFWAQKHLSLNHPTPLNRVTPLFKGTLVIWFASNEIIVTRPISRKISPADLLRAHYNAH